jgi:hypothetical protein
MADGMLSQFVPAYGYGKKTKKMETTPHKYDKETMNYFIQGMRAGEKYGVPQLDKQTLAGMAMQEGPTHAFGFNENMFNKNNKQAVQVKEKLIADGISPRAATFAASVFDKQQVAARKNVPFEMAWNGLGVNAYGQSGKQYAELVGKQKELLQDPKNASFVSWLDKAYDMSFDSPAEAYATNISKVDETVIPNASFFKSNLQKKLIEKGYKEDAKALEGMDDFQVRAAALNMYKQLAGVAPSKTSSVDLDRSYTISKGAFADPERYQRAVETMGQTTKNISANPNIVNEINRTINPDAYKEPSWFENPLYRVRNLF